MTSCWLLLCHHSWLFHGSAIFQATGVTSYHGIRCPWLNLQEAPFSHDKFTTAAALDFVEETKGVRSGCRKRLLCCTPCA
jgi:hypothetical protein